MIHEIFDDLDISWHQHGQHSQRIQVEIQALEEKLNDRTGMIARGSRGSRGEHDGTLSLCPWWIPGIHGEGVWGGEASTFWEGHLWGGNGTNWDHAVCFPNCLTFFWGWQVWRSSFRTVFARAKACWNSRRGLCPLMSTQDRQSFCVAYSSWKNNSSLFGLRTSSENGPFHPHGCLREQCSGDNLGTWW